VAVGTGGFVGSGRAVGTSASVAVATGEQAASPLSMPSAPTFKASRREIFLFMGIPPKRKLQADNTLLKHIRAFNSFGFLYWPYIAAGLEIA